MAKAIKIVVLETFEQGMDRKEGGVIKLFKDSEYSAERNERGLVINLGKVSRTIPTDLVTRLAAQKLIRIDEA